LFRFQEIPPDGDPSQRIQEFRDMLPRLLCCRYWYMEEWKSQQMSFPYWRMYWNRSGKARVVYKKTIDLVPEKIILIPPNTPFASDIEGSKVENSLPYSLKGGRVESEEMESEMIDKNKVLHMFVHFNLGYPFDSISPEIFEFDMDGIQESLIHSITRQLIAGTVMFDHTGSLALYALLFSLLHQLPPGIWKTKKLDARIVNGIRYMEKNIGNTSILNSALAREGAMSVNAYARLFKEQTGYSPRKYLLRMRVEKASNMLHHSELSIDQIAASCGFSDRYYFTKIFGRTMKISPGVYRRSGMM